MRSADARALSSFDTAAEYLGTDTADVRRMMTVGKFIGYDPAELDDDIWRWRSAISAEDDLFVGTRLAALRLSFHVRAGGIAECSQAMLSVECGMARSSIQRHFNALCDSGWLTRHLPDRRGMVSTYGLSWPQGRKPLPDPRPAGRVNPYRLSLPGTTDDGK